MAKSHHDKIAVVSGGANGIGQAFAQRLAQDGAHIVIADIAPGSNTVKMVEQAGRQALACTCDVSSMNSVKALGCDVAKHFGRCDILVNCAGIFPNQPFDEMTFADWRRVLAINLDSVFLMSAAFAPGMKQRQWGRIVNMASSTLGSVVSGFVHYMASKAGIVGITRALASELGPFGITVNAISPGLTRSPGTIDSQPGPVILVGHSYGGAVITEAGTDPNVAGLVYITAFAPDKGESVNTLIANPPSGAPTPPILPPKDGYLFLDKVR